MVRTTIVLFCRASGEISGYSRLLESLERIDKRQSSARPVAVPSCRTRTLYPPSSTTAPHSAERSARRRRPTSLVRSQADTVRTRWVRSRTRLGHAVLPGHILLTRRTGYSTSTTHPTTQSRDTTAWERCMPRTLGSARRITMGTQIAARPRPEGIVPR